MDAFNQRIDLGDSFDVGDDLTISVDLTPSSMSSSASSFGPHSPGGDVGSELVKVANDTSRERSAYTEQLQQQQQQQSEYKHLRRPLYEAPEFVHRLNVFEEIDIGGTVTFECQVRAFPRPLIKWYKDDVEVSSFPLTMQSDVNDDGSVAASRVQSEDLTGQDSSTEGMLRLVIHDARKDDEGAYRCKAENEEGVAATTGYLSVTGPASNQAGSNGSPQASPRINAVSAPPLLRAITEQQSMEEREAAMYVQEDDDSAINLDDDVDDEVLQSVPDVPILSSDGDWSTYADYLQKALGDDSVDLLNRPIPGGQPADNGSGSDTSCELDDFTDELKIVEPEVSSTVAVTAASEPSTSRYERGGMSPVISGTSDTGNGLVNDEFVSVGVFMINVMVVEDDHPDESAVAAAVIIGSAESLPENSIEDSATSATGVEVAETEPMTSSIVFVGPTLAAAEQGDGKGFIPGTSSEQSLPVSLMTPGAGDSRGDGHMHPSIIGAQLTDSSIIDTSNCETADVIVQQNVSDAHRLVDPETRQPTKPDLDFESTDLRCSATSDTLESQAASEKTADSDEVFQSGADEKRANGASRVSAGGRKSMSTQFSIGGLLRDIFPVKSEKTSPSFDASSSNQPVSEIGEDRKDVRELPPIAVVNRPRDSIDVRSPGQVHSRPSSKRQPQIDTIELSWSNVFDWYIGWFEMPWIFYAIMAVVFTLAATAGAVDPAWVIITAVVASMLAFRLFPVPTKATAIQN